MQTKMSRNQIENSSREDTELSRNSGTFSVLGKYRSEFKVYPGARTLVKPRP